ncbi:RluA family pseudouridine synthase [Roseivirga sp. 4D4]|uniref:RluA family pseudouridine synthase n=1 Tax=Roseivirga sp. 4D4 TaxID=1889784 RepID=UPI000A576A4E|nr:RluA family pseudouridine synthase [Roseivirga sp. 4D4]
MKKQLIEVNGLTASTATWIKGGETITLYSIEGVKPKRPLIFPLKVLFEDEYLAIIHKPAGIEVSGNSFKTIANALSQNLNQSNEADATVPQPVHRLDYATTGLLLVGKTSSSIRALNKLFEDKGVNKTYYAITIGQMDREGIITASMKGKEAKSHYCIADRVHSDRFGQLNLVELKPETGRRHQLRKHLASIGNPILGDKDYGTEGLILKGKGLYLHAYSLEFKHPFTNDKILQIDELPLKFKKIFPLWDALSQGD